MSDQDWKQNGLYRKYKITKADGTPLDAGARYFPLRYDGGDPNAELALKVYAASVRAFNATLADDLLEAMKTLTRLLSLRRG
ncbi:MAG: hypothetical protein WCA07_09615 [Gloeobacterales cyanobacterium]